MGNCKGFCVDMMLNDFVHERFLLEQEVSDVTKMAQVVLDKLIVT